MAQAETQLMGALWVTQEGRRLFGSERLRLLEHIGEHGSISAAAKTLGMSYRAAWDAVADMNNLADAPLTHRTPGGRHGGSTELTGYGRQLVAAFRAMEHEYARLLDGLNAEFGDWDRLQALMRRFAMRTSARNQWQGRVLEVKTGPVNAEVTLALDTVDRLVATVTRESVDALGLQPGRDVYALVKSSFVILATADDGFNTTARNRLCGTVTRLVCGPVNAEVTLELDGGKTLTATITTESADALGLEEGVRACALFKASHVILGVN
ncbi:MAG: TOBE domain-containing protein [Gammaproteobacteria bacterium]|jgi:molybdate transport system regulatory protein